MAKLFDAISSACAEVTKAIKTYIDTVALVEKDPTVPAWAKKANKPEYKAEEIEGLANVAKSGNYNDLQGLPNLGPSNYTSEEFDTGKKWIHGETIYGIAYERYVTHDDLGDDDMLLVSFISEAEVRYYIGGHGAITGPTGSVYLLNDASEKLKLGLYAGSGIAYVHTARLYIYAPGYVKAVLYYIKP